MKFVHVIFKYFLLKTFLLICLKSYVEKMSFDDFRKQIESFKFFGLQLIGKPKSKSFLFKRKPSAQNKSLCYFSERATTNGANNSKNNRLHQLHRCYCTNLS